MFIGRKDELRQLDSVFQTDRSNLVVLYGREGIGKTTLALKFAEQKRYVYYRASELSEQEQINRFNYLDDQLAEIREGLETREKTVLIVDEFHYITADEMIQKLLGLVNDEEHYGRFMVMLLSSSINWVENRMVSEHKSIARAVTGIIKIRDLSFAEMVEWFPKASVEDCIAIRALMGGVPRYLKLWQENRRLRENMLSLFFAPDAPLLYEPERLLRADLRELNAYNTILIALASGRYKLNDIFAYTGFSRAKISVYLKNLIEMDIVEKIYSVNVKKSENTKKGLYRIKDNMICFYYAYVFPSLSLVETGRGRQIYNDLVSPHLEEYLRPHFADVCREYLELMSKYKKLGFRYNEWHTWYGKTGTIDIIGRDEDRHLLAAYCCYSEDPAGVEEYKVFKQLIEDSGIKPQKQCMFARAGFTAELTSLARNEGMLTVAMSEL